MFSMICRLALVLAAALAVDPQVSQPAPRSDGKETLQGAVNSAKSTLQRITSLGDSVESSMHQSVQEAEKQARQRAEADLGVRSEQLSEHFVSMQKEAASDVEKSQLDSARQVLKEMEVADAKLRELESHTSKLVDDASRHIEDSGRDAARKARDQADALARQARQQTDHLDRVARRFDLPDMSDRFDRMAEKAARHAADAAEKGARVTEDAARNLPRHFDAQVAKARRQRREALHSVRELLDSAEQKATDATAVGLVAVESRKPEGKDVRFLVVGAASAGAAAAVLMTVALRHIFKAEDDMDKYLLVV